MSGEYVYKKTTRDDVDFPRYCYFFIKELMESIEDNEIVDPGDELEVSLETSQYPYCYDALELVVRTFERKGFHTRIPTFKVNTEEDNTKVYVYKWELKKVNPCDDLPF